MSLKSLGKKKSIYGFLKVFAVWDIVMHLVLIIPGKTLQFYFAFTTFSFGIGSYLH